MCAEPAVYYDPYDVDINADPYPTYARLREEAPVYYNDVHDFWALSRHADVEKGLLDVISRARDEKLYTAITDCGAGGLSSAVGEMASEVGATAAALEAQFPPERLRTLIDNGGWDPVTTTEAASQ